MRTVVASCDYFFLGHPSPKRAAVVQVEVGVAGDKGSSDRRRSRRHRLTLCKRTPVVACTWVTYLVGKLGWR